MKRHCTIVWLPFLELWLSLGWALVLVVRYISWLHHSFSYFTLYMKYIRMYLGYNLLRLEVFYTPLAPRNHTVSSHILRILKIGLQKSLLRMILDRVLTQNFVITAQWKP